MSAVRLNFSHGTKAKHLARIRAARSVSRITGCRLAVLMDLQGPKIRVGSFKGGEVRLEKGNSFTLTTSQVTGDASRASTTYEALPHDVRRGSRIFLADGSMELIVQKVQGGDVLTEVVRGGALRNNQGINLPGTPLRTPSLTAKDRADLDFGLRHGVDLVALSFVRRSKDVEMLRRMVSHHPKPPWIVVKIEKQEALDEIEAILDAADGVMVARGDLGVEVGLERVPEIQKRVIAEANRRGRFSITATQMLESMIDHPRPTRAEVSDVANAVFDGTDALMLSAESAVGAYPARAVEIMRTIAEEAENSAFYAKAFEGFAKIGGFHRAASYAATSAAKELGAAAVISITPTGRMPRLLARFRLSPPVIACSASDAVLDRLSLIWGVVPLKIATARHAERAIEGAINAARASGLIAQGQYVVVTLSMLSGGSEATNVVKLHRV